MCHAFLATSNFWSLLLRIDEDLAAQTRAAGCCFCGGLLHRADYARKPRGVNRRLLGAACERRLSLCCAQDGCRRRHTPPSVRFLGRRVFLGAVVVLATALAQGLTGRRAAVLRALFGETYATSGNVRGAAVWLTPGETEMTPERVAAAEMDQAPVVLGAKAWERFMGVMKYMESLHAADMPDDHWYLAAIGVDPEAAGTGLGSALLRPVLEAADRQGRPCYLETVAADNRPFYEKHGFVVVRQGVEPVSGLEYWTFRRVPR